MEIKVGIRQVAREVVLETDEEASAISAAFSGALKDGGLLTLSDTQGRTVMIPAESIGYLELGKENARRVGFGLD